MSKTFKKWKDESRGEWGTTLETNENITGEALKIGCLMRIADASEKMASNYTTLQNDRDWYKKRYEQECATTKRLQHQINGLKGAITRMNKKQTPTA